MGTWTPPAASDQGPRERRTHGGPRAAREAPVPILVVDDRQENLIAIESVLRSPDHELVLAASGAEALRFLLHRDCALILLDVQMPELDGFETARLVRSNERTRAIPIVFMTAISRDERFVARGYAVGAIDYIVKPIDPDILRSKVGAFVELYRARQEIVRQAALLRESERAERERVLEQLELRALRLRHAAAERHRRLVEGISHAILWTLSPATLTCTFVSPSAERILGVAADAWTGSPDGWRARLPPDHLDRLLAALAGVAPGASVALDHDLLRGDGRRARFHTRLELCPGEDEGTVEIRAFSVDVTEEREAQDALVFLARAGAELAASLDVEVTASRAAALAVPLLADACAVTVATPGRAPVVGVAHADPARLEEARALPAHPALAAAATAREPRPIALDGGGALLALPLRCRERDLGAVHLRRGAGRPYALRELRLAEELAARVAQALDNALLYREVRDAVRARDEFISVASHELRTPLTPLSLQTSALRRLVQGGLPAGELRDGLLERITGCGRQVERMTRLVGNLLDVTRLRARVLELHLEELDACELVRDAAARCQEEIARTGRKVGLDAPGEPVRGRWDRTRLDQVVTNLLANAVRYGGSGGIEVALRRDGDGVVLAVRDHGVGIAPEDQARIFDRFERGQNAGANGGLGLGLYIVRHIVEAHGGRVRVDSCLGEGSTFTVELPLEARPTAKDGAESDGVAPGDPEPALAAPPSPRPSPALRERELEDGAPP